MTLRLLLALSLLTLTACKTSEQIKRDKKVDEIAVQSVQGQRIMADYTARLEELEERVRKLLGQAEEGQYKTKQQLETTQKTFNERLKTVEEQMKGLLAKQDSFSAALDEQKAYIDQVIASLSKISTGTTVSNADKKDGAYISANKLFEKEKFEEAAELFTEVIKSKKYSAKEKAHAYHQLGLISFGEKRYSDALTHFSTLITKYPKSPFVPSALLHLGRTFEAQKDFSSAKASWQELITKYSSSSHSKKAKVFLEKLER